MEKFYALFSKYYHNKLLEALESNINENQKVFSFLQKKFIHTFQVVMECKELCIRENISKDVAHLCEIACTFHDIGRFEQLIQYGTFDDSISLDHAKLSADIFESMKLDILELISEREFDIVKNAIENHSKLNVPTFSDDTFNTVVNILRDSDKLQILSINYKSYECIEKLVYSLDEKVSESCVDSFKANSVISNRHVETIYDYRAKCCSWIFDFNYKSSRDKMISEGYLDILLNTDGVSDTKCIEDIKSLKRVVGDYLVNDIVISAFEN